jgi:hypothetical protein
MNKIIKNVDKIVLNSDVASDIYVSFHNETTSPKLLTFEANCGCTVPKSDLEIAPGATADAGFTITKRKLGDFSQTVTVFESREGSKYQVGFIKFSGIVQ